MRFADAAERLCVYFFKIGTRQINEHIHVNSQDYNKRLISVFSPFRRTNNVRKQQ